MRGAPDRTGARRAGRSSARDTVVSGQTTQNRTTTSRSLPLRIFETRSDLLDAMALVVLGGIALAGLADTFTGGQYLLVGAIGLVLGTLVTRVTVALRWPFAAAVLAAVALFYLLGGALTLRSMGNAALLPSRSTVQALSEQAVYGWRDLLTTLPPVDGTGVLLVLPWLLGLLIGVLGTGLAAAPGRWPLLRAALPLLVPLAALLLVLLLGVAHPVSVLLQGACFAGVAVLWLTVRMAAVEPGVKGGGPGLIRGLSSLALLVLAASIAVPVAKTVQHDHRLVLREHVEPPFDIGEYPSPLASFRRYVDPRGHQIPGNEYDTALLEVDGLPAGSRVRFAAMDAYNGLVWGAADRSRASGDRSVPDTFQRVSGTIENSSPGVEVDVTITLDAGYGGVWLPVPGELRGLTFESGDPRAKRESFRYNVATATAVVPSGLHPGDRYRARAVITDQESVTRDTPAATYSVDLPEGLAFLNPPAAEWVKNAKTPMGQVFEIAEHLRTQGRYSDGVARSERRYVAGHSLNRLGPNMVGQPVMVGNDEQYAALMALLAIKVGVPARVVLGATVPGDGMVKGADVEAWVELQRADGTWGRLPTETFLATEKPDQLEQLDEQERSGSVVPPPAPIPPPSVNGDQADTDLQRKQVERDDVGNAGWGLPTWVKAVLIGVGIPLGLLLAVAAAIVGFKALRRRRRRRAPHTSTRVVGAWHEFIDRARDLGRPVPVGATVTRREQAGALGTVEAGALARQADTHVFGPYPPEGDEAANYWLSTEVARRGLSVGLGRWQRMRGSVSLRSLRRPRRLR